MTQKYIELVAAFQQPVNGLNQNDRDATIARNITFLGADAATTTSSSTANVARVTALLGEYQEKIRTLDEKKAAREALQKRFDEVVALLWYQLPADYQGKLMLAWLMLLSILRLPKNCVTSLVSTALSIKRSTMVTKLSKHNVLTASSADKTSFQERNLHEERHPPLLFYF